MAPNRRNVKQCENNNANSFDVLSEEYEEHEDEDESQCNTDEDGVNDESKKDKIIESGPTRDTLS